MIEDKIKYNDYWERVQEKDKEIERLNENNQAYQEEVCRVWEERDNLYRRILEAVEYIEKWQSFQHTNGTTHEELKNLKDILKGEIKWKN